MPMMTPTMAQAMPTVSADFALSASESRQAASVALPPRVSAEIATSNKTTPATGMISIPSRDSEPAISARPTQNKNRSALLEKPSVMLVPRISATVSASPTLPA